MAHPFPIEFMIVVVDNYLIQHWGNREVEVKKPGNYIRPYNKFSRVLFYPKIVDQRSYWWFFDTWYINNMTGELHIIL